MFGPRIPATTLERLWVMLAHDQGCLLNASQLAKSINISTHSVTRYITWNAQAYFYRTAAGAEMGLVIDFNSGKRIAIEIKRVLSANPGKGFYQSIEDMKPGHSYLVHAGEDRYPVTEHSEATGVNEMVRLLSE